LNDTLFIENEEVASEGNNCLLRLIGVIMNELVPEGQMVNQKHYLEVLTKLQEQVEKKCWNCGTKNRVPVLKPPPHWT
jgi:hypothetical protein